MQSSFTLHTFIRMEINHRVQSKFLKEPPNLFIEMNGELVRETSFLEIELILKDIRFVRHELANYGYLYASQFSFDAHLDRSYWEFLHVKGPINDNERNELEEGVLLIFFLWLNEYFEAENFPYVDRKALMKPILKSLVAYAPDDEIKTRLVSLITRAIEHMDHLEIFRKLTPSVDERQMIDQLTVDAEWVYATLVEGYFTKIANSFQSNRERQAEFNTWIRNNARGKDV